MQNNNALTPLLQVAADVYGKHNSKIGRTARDCLLDAMDKPIVKNANSVSQCTGLAQAYAQTNSELNRQAQSMENQLHWADTDAGVKPKAVQERLAFVELVSPSGMVLTENCRVGLFFQGKDTDYPNHHHAAEELYVVVSGRALWANDANKTPTIKQPGEFIHHQSWETHKMKTIDEPLLAMWCWTGDIGFDQYKML